MSTKQRVKAAVEKAGVAFEACWATLMLMREPRKPSSSEPSSEPKKMNEALFSFQPLLAKAIHTLDNLHLQIKRHERDAISKKKTIWARTFAARLKLLAFYDKVVVETLGIGKTLGDAFAWFFYMDDKELLAKHLQHEFVKHTPGGPGGRGELAFIQNLQVSNGHLALYHGNTTILRIGDVSFVDLETFQVTGLGEIKSCEVEPNVIHGRLEIFGPTAKINSIYAGPPAAEEHHNSGKELPEPSQRMKDRFQRQRETMALAFKPKDQKQGAPIAIETLSTRDSFVELCKSLETVSAACQKCGDGLLLLAVRPSSTESFSSRMFAAVKGREKWDLGDFEKHALTVLDHSQDPKNSWNSLEISEFTPAFQLGTVPFCWWQIDSTVIKRVIFQDIIIVTIYNPAFLVKKLQAAGFDVRRTGKRDEFTASKRSGSGTLMVPECEYFIRLITNHFMSEDGVLRLFTSTEERIVQDRLKHNTKVEMLIDLRH
jgi:hypothetical protein